MRPPSHLQRHHLACEQIDVRTVLRARNRCKARRLVSWPILPQITPCLPYPHPLPYDTFSEAVTDDASILLYGTTCIVSGTQ